MSSLTVRRSSPIVPAIAAGAGVLSLLALWLARRSKAQTAQAVTVGGGVRARLTTYWPLKPGLSASERKMEGGVNDRKGRPIITWEQHVSDPARYPYVSVAGDYGIWPYGQRVVLSEFPNVVLRVVDTGGHFFGANKVYRVAGHEPLDIAVNDDKSHDRLGIPRTATVRIVPGDNFEGGKAVAVSKLPGPVIAGESYDADDLQALASMVETCAQTLSDDEARAMAWAVRNRASVFGEPVTVVLDHDHGYAPVTASPTPRAARIALEVLSASPLSDPTNGAIGFWVPKQQKALVALGRSRMDEPAVREAHAASGIRPVKQVGAVELLAEGARS